MNFTKILHFQITIFPLIVLIMLAFMDVLRLFTYGGTEWTTIKKVLSLASGSLIMFSLYPAKLLHQGICKKDARKVNAFMKYHYLIFVPTSILYLYKEHLNQFTELPPDHFKPYGILSRLCWYIISVNCVLCAPLAYKVGIMFKDEKSAVNWTTRSDFYLKWHGLNLFKILYFQMILILLYTPLEIFRFYRFLNYGAEAATYRNHVGYIVSNILYISTLFSLRIGTPFYYYGIKRNKYSTVKYYFVHKTLVFICGGGFYLQVCEFEENISLIYEGFYQKLSIIFYGLWASVEMSQIMQMLIYISKKEDMKKFKQNAAIQSIESNCDDNVEDEIETGSEVQVSFLKISKQYRISSSQLKADMIHENFLGEGQFGKVWKGVLTCKDPKRTVQVAVKIVNGGPDREFAKSLMEEVRVFIRTGDHPNLVKFYGACTSRFWQLAIILELCEHGNLKSWFEKPQLSTFSSNTLMQFLHRWSLEIAIGMEYLSSKKVVHGDLALRNILLDGEMTAKISDFGMSLRLYNYQHYAVSQMKVFPWNWMAPESLNDLKFSTESDIWSFGVLLWEMFSLGDIPWSGFDWNSNFANLLIQGLHLLKPELASDQIYQDVMIQCWQIEKMDRLSFSELTATLRTYCKQESSKG